MKTNNITLRLKAFLEKDLEKLMQEYEGYRLDIAKVARSGGDVREALKEEVLWENKIKHIKELMRNRSTVTPVRQNEIIALGTKAVISVDGKERQIIIDGVGYKTKAIDVISQNSLVGKSLIGKKAGDAVAIQAGVVIVVKKVLYPW
ncbi:hypothetical protein JXK06_02505 [Patescibacteria group bacterium]|nr:hypothetical protein [Patescibacteria group bacterium]